jgi:hypothetical protein
MEGYPDPLAAGEPPQVLGDALAPPPLIGYVEPPPLFGDALASPAPAADPTAAPLSALTSSVFGLTESGPGVDGSLVEPVRVVIDAPAVEETPVEAVERSAMEAGEPVDPPTTRLVLPAAQPPRPEAAGGRYELGLPRGWDPPSVPANRGWSTSPAARERQPRRRPAQVTRQLPAPRQQPARQPPPLAGLEVPQELAELMAMRGEQAGRQQATFWTKFTIVVVLGLVAFGEAFTRNWAGTAIFAGLTLIVVRPRTRPKRIAAAQAAAQRRRRSSASDWPRRPG